MHSYRIFILVLITSAGMFSGCRTGLFGSDTVEPPQQPAAPAAPIVVDGTRTSYADVVQKTSPAVVRIEAESKGRTARSQQSPFGDDDFFRQFPMPRQNQRPPTERGMGSGVIVSADGTIL